MSLKNPPFRLIQTDIQYDYHGDVLRLPSHHTLWTEPSLAAYRHHLKNNDGLLHTYTNDKNRLKSDLWIIPKTARINTLENKITTSNWILSLHKKNRIYQLHHHRNNRKIQCHRDDDGTLFLVFLETEDYSMTATNHHIELKQYAHSRLNLLTQCLLYKTHITEWHPEKILRDLYKGRDYTEHELLHHIKEILPYKHYLCEDYSETLKEYIEEIIKHQEIQHPINPEKIEQSLRPLFSQDILTAILEKRRP